MTEYPERSEPQADAGIPPRASTWRTDKVLLTIVAFLAGATYFLRDLPLCAAPLLGLALAVIAAIRLSPRRLAALDAVIERKRRLLRWAAAGLIAVHLWLGVLVLGAARGVALAHVFASDLKALAAGLAAYYADNAEYPPSLAALEFSGHTEYALQPGAGAWQSDPRLILAYEREHSAFRPQWNLRGKRGRWVLFANSEVRWLRDDEFERAQQADSAQRRELDWPIP